MNAFVNAVHKISSMWLWNHWVPSSESPTIVLSWQARCRPVRQQSCDVMLKDSQKNIYQKKSHQISFISEHPIYCKFPCYQWQGDCLKFITPPAQWSCCGRGGILVSLRLSRIPCLLCSAHSSGWIHFIFIDLIKQLQKVCCMWSFLQNFKIWIFGYFL